jgi:long-chain-alcohol oxidase
MGACEERRRRARRGHPLLRGVAAGKRERYTHGFSASQMAALAALCGAYVPSLPPPPDRRSPHVEEEEEFFRASAGGPPVPDEVAELMSRMCLPEALALVRTVLWLLSTRLGSLALCGAPCLSWRFPFVRRFADLPPERREGAVRRWSRQTMLPPLRVFFLVTKVFCLYVFYSMVRPPLVTPSIPRYNQSVSAKRTT